MNHKMRGQIENIADFGGAGFANTYDELNSFYQRATITANRYNVARRLYDYAMHPDTFSNVRRELLSLLGNNSLLEKVILISDRSAFRCIPWVFRDQIRLEGQSFEEATCIAMYLENQTWAEKTYYMFDDDEYDDFE